MDVGYFSFTVKTILKSHANQFSVNVQHHFSASCWLGNIYKNVFWASQLSRWSFVSSPFTLKILFWITTTKITKADLVWKLKRIVFWNWKKNQSWPRSRTDKVYCVSLKGTSTKYVLKLYLSNLGMGETFLGFFLKPVHTLHRGLENWKIHLILSSNWDLALYF